MKIKTIVVGKDFSIAPSGRELDHFPFGGEAFRVRKLVPALKEHEKVVVDLAGVEGYGSSFLDEAFAGLIRKESYTLSQLQERLEIMTSDPTLQISVDDALQDMIDAQREQDGK